MANEMKFWKESWMAVILPFKLQKKKKENRNQQKGTSSARLVNAPQQFNGKSKWIKGHWSKSGNHKKKRVRD